jgi:hypothetical protein
VCMCACVHVCMCACVHVCMCACVHVCMCMCMCTEGIVHVRRQLLKQASDSAVCGPALCCGC